MCWSDTNTLDSHSWGGSPSLHDWYSSRFHYLVIIQYGKHFYLHISSIIHDNFHDNATIVHGDECEYNFSPKTFWVIRTPSVSNLHKCSSNMRICFFTNLYFIILQSKCVSDIRISFIHDDSWNNSFSSLITLISKTILEYQVSWSKHDVLDTNLETASFQLIQLINLYGVSEVRRKFAMGL